MARFSLVLAASLFISAASVSAAPLKPVYRLQDHGQTREFVIAQDELHQKQVPKRIPAKATIEETRRAADAEGADLVVYEKGQPRNEASRRLVTKRIALRLAAGADPAAIAAAGGVAYVGPAPGAAGWHLVQSGGGAGSALEAAERLRKIPGVLAADPLLARQQNKRVRPTDPLFSNQFYLQNTGIARGKAGIDLNVTPVWDNYKGDGIVIGIVDDGLDRQHPDLLPNYRADLSYDFNDDDDDPLPPPFDGDNHGTSCAGLAAARGQNGIGICGTAFQAGLAGLRLIAAPTTDADEAAAIAFRNDAIHIKSNSWGPPDDGRVVEGPGPLTAAAFEQAVREGRGGLGTLITWAGGNGADVGDASSFDGYANRREVIAVGGITNSGTHTYYAETGANILCTGFTDSATIGITSTDRVGEDGYNYEGARGEYDDTNYTNDFSGTSAATPMISGFLALLLQSRPTLGWRDVQEIIIRTARRVGATDFRTNGAGLAFSHQVGAGLPDAAAAVALAQTWVNLPPEISTEQEQAALATPIPDNRANGITKTFVFNDSRLRVEHAELELDIRHALRNQIEVYLTSPSGTTVKMVGRRPRDTRPNYLGLTLTTPHFWAETAAGTWTVTVADRVRGAVGTLQRVRLRLYGSAQTGHSAPDGFTVTSGSLSAAGQVAPGETATVAFRIRNDGAAPLTNATATLVAAAGVASPSAPVSLGTVAPGATVEASFTFTAAGPLGATVHPMIELSDQGALVGTLVYPITLGVIETKSFTRDGLIRIPAMGKTGGNAAPYGTTVFVDVGSLQAVITKVVLHLHGVRHRFSNDIDMLLVSPAGTCMIPLSDCGGKDAAGLDLTLDDTAEITAASSAMLSGGLLRPANQGSTIDLFPKPAPPRPYGANFAVFQGENPQGSWRLYIRDDVTGGVGSLSGWGLDITYAH